MALTVNQQSAEVLQMAREWPLLEALQSGTLAMRAGGASFLPRWPNESEKSYSARLYTATLFPAYRRTVSVMSGKPFSKMLALSDDTPAQIRKWAESIDNQGVNLHAFCAEMFRKTIGNGLAGILVDYPDTTQRDEAGNPVDGAPARTVAEIEAEGIRPYWVRVMHSQILGWRTVLVQGVLRLSQLRLMEVAEEPEGDFGTAAIEQVRVLTPGRWQTFRKNAKGDWEMHREGVTTLDYIPFVPLYGVREGFMVGRPPLIDLAYLNAKHWQSQSDQDTILHVARVPILAAIGVDEEGWELTVGASTSVRLPMGSELKYVEHSGAAISAGASALADLQNQMIETGAELLVKKPGERSATEAANDAEANKCDLQRTVETFEDALNTALQFTADFAGLDKGGKATLFKDFGAANLSEASAQLVLSMQQGGLITKGTAIKELQRRGELDGEIVPEDELEAVDQEGPALGGLSDGMAPPEPKKRIRLSKQPDGSMLAEDE